MEDVMFDIQEYKGYQLELEENGSWRMYHFQEWFWETYELGFSSLEEARAYIDVIERIDEPVLSKGHVELLRITVGADINTDTANWGDRNKLFVSEFSAFGDAIEYLRRTGYMAITQRYRNGTLFHATEKAMKALGFSDAQVQKARSCL